MNNKFTDYCLKKFIIGTVALLNIILKFDQLKEAIIRYKIEGTEFVFKNLKSGPYQEVFKAWKAIFWPICHLFRSLWIE